MTTQTLTRDAKWGVAAEGRIDDLLAGLETGERDASSRRKAKQEWSVELITPAHAAKLLDKLKYPELAGEVTPKKPETKRSGAAIHAYAEAMRAGEWEFNAEPISISSTGVLLDGYKRLAACVEAKTPFPTLLVQNLDDEVWHTIDQQRRRRYAGALESRGFKHAGALMSAMMKLVRYQDGAMEKGNYPISWARLDRVLEANPDLVEAVDWALSYKHRVLGEAVRVPLVFMGRRADQAAMERFLDAVSRPQLFNASEPGVIVRTRLDNEKGSRKRKDERMSPTELFAVCIKALNATMSGEHARNYSWKPVREGERGGEPFPQLQNYRGLKEPKVERQTAPVAVAGDKDLMKALGLDQFRVTVESVSPKQAAAWLANNAGNRKIVRAHVEAIKRDILAGRWLFNGRPICFEKGTDRMLNGQHRATAIVETGVTIETAIARGLNPRAFDTYDQHAKKAPTLPGLGDSIHDQDLVFAAAKLFWENEVWDASKGKARPTASELREVLEQHPGLVEARHFGRRAADLWRSSLMTYIGYKVVLDDKQLAPDFLEALEIGAGLSRTDPLLKLRNKLFGMRKRSKNTDQGVVLKMILDVWEGYRRKHGRKPRSAGRKK